ncbi:MAG: RNA methyltransferase [Gammaproteobacteria bacterium]|nr:RNA methyltransferase [Gammaproteobacteria bacterium]
MSLANKIRIVLVNTSHPGNIGAAARVMKNMSLNNLYLVEPKLFPHADATAMAAGADELLFRANVVSSLAEALQGCSLVFGTTARTRKIKHQIVEPHQAALLSAQKLATDKEASAGSDIAFVFGRERTGLTNDEVDLCEKLINIPCNKEFSSLNVASAVQIMAYELFMAIREKEGTKHEESFMLKDNASHDELELFFEHLQKTLIDIDFFDPKKSPQIMPKLRHLFHRAELEKSEVNILRGILTAALKLKS